MYKATSKMRDTLFVAVGILSNQALFSEPHQAFAENCQLWDRNGTSQTSDAIDGKAKEIDGK
ncbi:hypothetical protein MUY35_07745 [Aliiroseovarius sp. S1339]|nr:hypothetical protein [Aliiroseovarius sp. S1339]